MELELLKYESNRCSNESQQLMNTEFNSWTFWFYKKENDKMWNECIHEVATCKSIDEFWTLIKSIRRPSHLDAGSDYAFFRNSIPPYWEDERNENGGRWKIIIDRFIPYGEVNKLWMDILLILMNEKLMWNSSICGVVFSSRSRHIKIAIWIDDSTKCDMIGRELRSKLHLSEMVQFSFEKHPKQC